MNLSTFGVLVLSLTVIHAKQKFHENLSADDRRHYFGTAASQDVPDYDIVHPVHVSGSRHRRSVNAPKPPLEYQIHALGEKYHLQLKHNDELIAPGCLVTMRGGEERVVPCPVREHDCYYHGHSLSHQNSTVALSVCAGLHGIISTPSHELVIQPIREEHRKDHKGEHSIPPHIVYRVAARRKKRCALQSTAENIMRSASRLRRQAGFRYVEMLLVADKTMYRYHKDDLTRYMLTAANIAAGRFLHKSLGVQLHLTILKIQILEDDIPALSIIPDADTTLTNFCKWQERFNPDSDQDPGHVDAASLFTKTDLIHMGVQSTTGLATVAGMCTKNIRCSVIEDDGLDLGLTLAHETGHSLNMHHDGESNECTDLTNIMSTGGGGGPQSFRWSSCSATYLKEFLGQGKGSCLNDEPQGKVRALPKDLPGVIYPGEDQCGFFVGDGSSLCTGTSLVDQFGGDECAKLICYDPNFPGQCKGSQIPRMDGTECGKRKWCQQGKCVDIGPDGPKPQDGGWSEYSQEWTACSRTCGGGTRYKSRKCNNPRPLFGGKNCEGPDILAELCNLQMCSTSQLTFKKEQCAATDSDPLYGQLLHWIPQDSSDSTQCQLYCRPEGQGTVRMRTLDGNKIYKDGTLCTAPGSTYGRCVAGQCKAFGCDGVSDSGRTSDKCGVCSGNGNTCKKMAGKYNKGEGQKYVTFVKLSKGTTGIVFTNKNRYSVLTLSVGGSRVVNKKDGQRDRSGSYTLGGVTVKYRPYPEKLEVVGTLTEDAEAQVYRVYGEGYQGAEPDITYEYYVPKNQNKPKEFTWKTKEGACSVTCGSGTRQTDVVCTKARTGATVESYLCNLADKPSSVGKACSLALCPASWHAGSFSQCSKSCNGGTQSREVRCVRSGETVADGQCRGNKPSASQECNTMECPGEWRPLDWTQCSKTCSRGVQTRTVKCYLNNQVASDSKCLPSNKPATTQSCLTAVCNTDITGDACADKAECKDYDTTVCAEYGEWAQTNCMAKCGYCKASSSSSGICEDKSEECKDYGKSACEEYKEWASENCASFCGFCTSTGQSLHTCTDTDPATCKEYGKDACTKWPEWAQKNCPSMCNMCPTSAVATAAPSSECKDVDTDTCVGQGKSACTEYAEWAQINCAKFCNLCPGAGSQVSGGQAVDTCKDLSDQCSGYDESMCNEYKEWAQLNCQKRCNFCEGKVTQVVASSAATTALETTPTQVDSGCKDTADCAAYGSSVCSEYAEWAAINCKRSCGKCEDRVVEATTAAATSSDCADAADCSAYGANVCSAYAEWAALNCKKFCGKCSSNEVTAKQTTPTTKPTTTVKPTTTAMSTTTTLIGMNSACSDKADCGAYGKDVCTQYADWAAINCQRSCGHCEGKSATSKLTTKATTAAIDPDCQDVRADCEGYGKSACTQYEDWARLNCNKFCGFCGGDALTETTPKPAATTTVETMTQLKTTANVDPSCTDVIADCAGYGKSACTQYVDWAKINCNKFCGFCGGYMLKETTRKPAATTTVATTTQLKTTANVDPSCTDVSADCSGYGKSACTQYADWAKINCKKFCGYCGSAATTEVVNSNCQDTQTDCATYGASACSQYADWAASNCRKFCNLCGSGAVTTVQATTTRVIEKTEAVDTSSSDTCKDTADCGSYGATVCTEYGDWAKLNCKKFCGTCSEDATCKDASTDCAAYGANVCTEYAEWATINCKKHCKIC